MAVTNIRASCGCGVIVVGPPDKVIEEATRHCQDKKHIMTVLGTIKPERK